MKTHTLSGIPGRITAWALVVLMAFFPTVSSAQQSQPSELSNMSVRVNVPAGDSFVAGFVVQGMLPRRLLIRAIGPGLRDFGVTDANPDARIVVKDSSGATIATNDDWQMQSSLNGKFIVEPAEIVRASAQVGAFPLKEGSWDAAVIVTVPAGAYTVTVTGRQDPPELRTSGLILLELYKIE
jgi:hypothetical protein